ncbi:uncharacterized protein LOC131243296 [Magnolia sinica]|uniref:uncharacterized protein LOC131243296 n=1 Tax=Magnolia sinica TaxID=86752 RepID=UPI0026586D45|nr:uncharacterized protein LOC131243296 [Magnolia sinica]XP_058098513.1 uncharacterized protein LOC131243296 [Magnolia sinica]
MLSLLQLKERIHFVLAPILVDDSSSVNLLRYLESFFECTENDFDVVLAEIEKEISMADIMKELGYGCTTNTSVCKEMLSLFSPLNEVTPFSTFCSTLSSNSTVDSSWLSSWNVGTFIGRKEQPCAEAIDKLPLVLGVLEVVRIGYTRVSLYLLFLFSLIRYR